MKIEPEKQRPPFEAAPDLLLPQLVDEQNFMTYKSVPCGCTPSGFANLWKGKPEKPTAVLPLTYNITQLLEDVKIGSKKMKGEK